MELNESIASAPAESGMSRLDDNVLIRFVSDEVFAGQWPEDVSYAYQLSIDQDPEEENEYDEEDAEGWPDGPEPGMTPSMCLMVDEECMRSVVARTQGSTAYVKAIDASLHRQQDGTLPYSGIIKVAVTSLITKFYAALLLYDPADVAATVGVDGVWTDIGPLELQVYLEFIPSLFVFIYIPVAGPCDVVLSTGVAQLVGFSCNAPE